MSSGEHWFSWSIYFPEDYKNNWPLKNMYGQFHEKGEGANVIWSFEQYPNGIVLALRLINSIFRW